ncbi:MAG: DNA-processing protein DprA [Candidatus Saccharimonadales bacterium]
MKSKKILCNSNQFPQKLLTLPDTPKELYILGGDLGELLARPAVAIVGSRKVSTYGRQVTDKLAGELARAGVVVISGLAIGVDGIAHRAALEAGGLTLAVLPGSVEQIYPANHLSLAKQIVEQGGALVSEYPAGTTTHKSNFIARNRIVAGLADAVLITEAAEKSGTLHTADFALQQGTDVLAVPGNITSPTSAGTNNLIRTGATIVTSANDIFEVLGIQPAGKQRTTAPKGGTPEEQLLLGLLFAGTEAGEELLEASKLDVRQFNQTLTMLEIRDHIRPLGNNRWSLK